MPEHIWFIICIASVFLAIAMSDESKRIARGFLYVALGTGAILLVYMFTPKSFEKVIIETPKEGTVIVDDVIFHTENNAPVELKKEATSYFGGLIKDSDARWILSDSDSSSPNSGE